MNGVMIMQATNNINRTSGQLDPKCNITKQYKNDNSDKAEYIVQDTRYLVKSVFQNTSSIESLENKIMRLIVGDGANKQPAN